MASSLMLAIWLLLWAIVMVTVESCPPGQYGAEICSDCPKGFYKHKAGPGLCYPCPKGHYCPVKSEPPKACPPGTASMRFVSYRVTCFNCSAGSYQDKPGQLNCIDCPDGYKCPDPGAQPVPCPPGTHSYPSVYLPLSTECVECSNGYYQDKPGQQNCIKCPDGHHCPEPKIQAIPCPPGTSSSSSLYSRQKCYDCSNGYYQDKPGQPNCLPCPEGHYCPIPKTKAIPCPPGKISLSSYYPRLTCLDCSNGYYQDKLGQRACIACPDGHYCPNTINRPVPCPAGTTSQSSVRARTSCTKCSPGRCLNPASSPKICPPGTHSWGANSCIPCSRGYYQAEFGQKRCNACPSGFHCPDASKKPVPCPPGTHMAQGWSSCRPCSSGRYQLQAGQSRCLECPEGQACASPSLPPVACPAGQRSLYFANSKCEPCPRDHYQTITGQPQCKICPRGHFCPKADQIPQQCPPNTFWIPGAPMEKKCKPCGPNHYQDQCGQTSCKPRVPAFEIPKSSSKCGSFNG